MKALLFYVAIVNVVAFFLYGIDKRKAIKGKFRISEMTLLLVALIGGSIGAFCGMQVFRHKTKHLKFKVGIPVIIFLQALGVVLLVLGR